jgi:GMP synthase (glutamine-hydrolysing)
MPNILIAEGTPAAWQAERADFGIPSNVSLFAAALQLHRPDICCTDLNIADGEPFPLGTALADFDGVMFPGSPLHIYDRTPAVTRQIDFARAAFAADVPVWGSCWGLQVATVALGDRSGVTRADASSRSPGRSRLPRPVEPTRSWPHVLSLFDALCSHLDEVETLPPNAEVLAANELSSVQAMAARTPRGGSFFGTQYHPEHTLAVSAALIEMRATELVEEGFAIEPAEIIAMAADYRTLAAEPTRRDLIWRYGIASEIIDPIRRTTEIGNWLETVVASRRLVA